MKEDEIDLSKYVRAILRRWHMLFLVPLILMVAIYLFFKVIQPAPFEAVASVAIVRWQTDITLDPKFRTLTDQDLVGGAVYYRSDARRNALLGLVKSGTLAERVLARLGDRLPIAYRDPAKLLARVKGELPTNNDLLLIRVRAPDPQVAADIATAWAVEYEQYINTIYSAKPALSDAVKAEQERTRQNYLQAQKQLEQFIAENQIAKITRQISMTGQIVSDLQQQTIQSFSTTIQQRLNMRTKMMEQYLRAQNIASSAVISNEIASRSAVLSDYYANRIELERLLSTVKIFRQQVAAGDDTSTRSDMLALLLLKAQIFTDRKSLPGQLQIPIAASAQELTRAEYLTDLDALIKTLEQRRTQIESDIRSAQKRLQDIQSMVDEPVDDHSPLQQAANNELEQLLSLNGLDTVIPEAEKTALIAKIDAQSAHLAELYSALERERARAKQLTQQRDLAWDTYTTVARKQTEVTLANAVPNSEVQMADAAVVPQQRAYSARLAVLAAGISGLPLGLFMALLVDVLLSYKPQLARFGQMHNPLSRALRWVLNEQSPSAASFGEIATPSQSGD